MSTLTEFPAYARLPEALRWAKGQTLTTSNHRQWIDFYGGHCVNTLGAGDPGIGAALAEQWQKLSFATNLFDHDGRDQFLAAWQPLLPTGDWQCFASNSGAEANENLLKAALTATGRKVVVCFEGAFHGRTAAAAAVSDHDAPFPATPFSVRRVPWGKTMGIDDQVAAVLLEPIQSLAGVIDPPDGFLQALRSACDSQGAWLLFDEVQTGNGRLGTPWASQYYGVTSDVFSTAKGVAGGLPLGLTFLAKKHAAVLPNSLFGSTFGGSPMALAASKVVAQRLSETSLLHRVRQRSVELQQLAGVGPVQAVRGAGLLLGLKLQAGWTAAPLRDLLLQAGILVGLCRDPQVLRLCPPLTLEASDVDRLAAVLQQVEGTA